MGIEICQNLINDDDGVERVSNTLKEIISTYTITARTKNDSIEKQNRFRDSYDLFKKIEKEDDN